MARRVDEIELVLAAIGGGVAHPNGIQLDRDATLALQVHRVEELLPHLTLLDRARGLDQPVGQSGFPMVDVGDDAEVANFGLRHGGKITRDGWTAGQEVGSKVLRSRG
jgi:hypothetical protein